MVDKIGYRKCIVAAHIFSAAGLAVMSVAPLLTQPFTGLLFAAVIYAVGGGLIEVLVSPIVEAYPTDNKASVMSLLHSFYCWGTLAVTAISTLFLHIFGNDCWKMLALLWALIPLFNAMYFMAVPIAPLIKNGTGMKMSELFKSRIFWLFAVIMLCAGASELSMSQWASAFAERGLGISKTAGDNLKAGIGAAVIFPVLLLICTSVLKRIRN